MLFRNEEIGAARRSSVEERSEVEGQSVGRVEAAPRRSCSRRSPTRCCRRASPPSWPDRNKRARRNSPSAAIARRPGRSWNFWAIRRSASSTANLRPLAGLAADDAGLSPQRGAYPKEITRASVSAFLSWPPPKFSDGKLRSATTIAKYCTHGGHLLRWLRIPVEIERRKRKKFNRLPPIVPKLDALVERWQAVLHSRVNSAQARQIVLTQALILLWGTRLSEALTALREDQEGHWVLVEGKTGMRISYLNSQALGLVQALKGQSAWDWAANRHCRVSGWGWSVNKWHAFVRECGIEDGDKPQQDLRKRFSTWCQAKDADVEKLLAGHGGDVIFRHYLDTLERVPAVMERFELPAVPGFAWPEPVYCHPPQNAEPGAWSLEQEAAAAAALTPPRRLYERFDRWLEEQERKAAG